MDVIDVSCQWCKIPHVMMDRLQDYLRSHQTNKQPEWLNALDEDLHDCFDCVREYHGMIGEVAGEDTLLASRLYDRDVRRLSDRLEVILSNSVLKSESAYDHWGRTTFQRCARVPLLELLLAPRLLLNSALAQRAIRLIHHLQDLSCVFQVDRKLPGLYLLFVHQDVKVSLWARQQGRKLSIIDAEEYSDLEEVVVWMWRSHSTYLQSSFTCAPVDNQLKSYTGDSDCLVLMNFVTDNPKFYWQGIQCFLLLLSCDALGELVYKHHLFIDTLLEVAENETEEFWAVLKCLLLLLHRLEETFWARTSYVPEKVLKAVSMNPMYKKEILRLNSSEGAECLIPALPGDSPYLCTFAWLEPFVLSMAHMNELAAETFSMAVRFLCRVWMHADLAKCHLSRYADLSVMLEMLVAAACQGNRLATESIAQVFKLINALLGRKSLHIAVSSKKYWLQLLWQVLNTEPNSTNAIFARQLSQSGQSAVSIGRLATQLLRQLLQYRLTDRQLIQEGQACVQDISEYGQDNIQFWERRVRRHLENILNACRGLVVQHVSDMCDKTTPLPGSTSPTLFSLPNQDGNSSLGVQIKEEDEVEEDHAAMDIQIEEGDVELEKNSATMDIQMTADEEIEEDQVNTRVGFSDNPIIISDESTDEEEAVLGTEEEDIIGRIGRSHRVLSTDEESFRSASPFKLSKLVQSPFPKVLVERMTQEQANKLISLRSGVGHNQQTIGIGSHISALEQTSTDEVVTEQKEEKRVDNLSESEEGEAAVTSEQDMATADCLIDDEELWLWDVSTDFSGLESNIISCVTDDMEKDELAATQTLPPAPDAQTVEPVQVCHEAALTSNKPVPGPSEAIPVANEVANEAVECLASATSVWQKTGVQTAMLTTARQGYDCRKPFELAGGICRPADRVTPRQSVSHASTLPTVQNVKTELSVKLDLEFLINEVFTWWPQWFLYPRLEENGKLMSVSKALPPDIRLSRVPDKFSSADDYVSTFKPLLICEAWAEIAKGFDELNTQMKKALVSWQARVCTANHDHQLSHSGRYKVTSCRGSMPTQPDCINEEDIVLVYVLRGSNDEVSLDNVKLAFRGPYNGRKDHAQTPVFFPEKYAHQLANEPPFLAHIKTKQILRQRKSQGGNQGDSVQFADDFTELSVSFTAIKSMAEGKKLLMYKICNLTPKQRIVSALAELPRNILCRDILSPRHGDVFKSRAEPVAVKDLAKVAVGYNESQERAIAVTCAAVLEPFNLPRISLLQGPPGTGKTHTVTGLLKTILEHKREVQSPMPTHSRTPYKRHILICAPSNGAVDELVMRLIAEGILKKPGECSNQSGCFSLIRAGRPASVHETVLPYSLDYQLEERLKVEKEKCKELPPSVKEELERVEEKIRECDRKAALNRLRGGGKSDVNQEGECWRDKLERLRRNRAHLIEQKRKAGLGAKHLRQVRERIQRNLLQDADLVAATLSGSGSARLLKTIQELPGNRLHFTCVLVDEAGQCTEPEVLIPLQYGCTKLVLVGDHAQLPATVMSTRAESQGFGRSLFQRFHDHFAASKEGSKSHPPGHMLETQYRMHPQICAFPSKHFYRGKLRTAESVHSRCSLPIAPFSVLNLTHGREDDAGRGKLCNPVEVQVVTQLCQRLLQQHFSSSQIGVITPYREHLKRMKEQLANCNCPNVEVGTVDGFQGREKDVIILSCVRARQLSRSIGFLANRQRLNVALTRARRCLIVVCHVDTLKVSADWNALLEHAEREGAIHRVTEGDRAQKIDDFLMRRVQKQQPSSIPDVHPRQHSSSKTERHQAKTSNRPESSVRTAATSRDGRPADRVHKAKQVDRRQSSKDSSPARMGSNGTATTPESTSYGQGRSTSSSRSSHSRETSAESSKSILLIPRSSEGYTSKKRSHSTSQVSSSIETSDNSRTLSTFPGRSNERGVVIDAVPCLVRAGRTDADGLRLDAEKLSSLPHEHGEIFSAAGGFEEQHSKERIERVPHALCAGSQNSEPARFHFTRTIPESLTGSQTCKMRHTHVSEQEQHSEMKMSFSHSRDVSIQSVKGFSKTTQHDGQDTRSDSNRAVQCHLTGQADRQSPSPHGNKISPPCGSQPEQLLDATEESAHMKHISSHSGIRDDDGADRKRLHSSSYVNAPPSSLPLHSTSQAGPYSFPNGGNDVSPMLSQHQGFITGQRKRVARCDKVSGSIRSTMSRMARNGPPLVTPHRDNRKGRNRRCGQVMGYKNRKH